MTECAVSVCGLSRACGACRSCVRAGRVTRFHLLELQDTVTGRNPFGATSCMGPCYAAGIRAGDRLLSINGELCTHGHSEAIEAMERSERFIEVVVAERVDSSPRPSGDAWLAPYQVDYA